MSRGSREQEVLSNKFGTITDKRVIFLSKKDLFQNGSREEMTFKQVVSVRFYQQKSFIAIILGSIGILLSIAVVSLLPGNLVALMSALLIIALCVCIAYIGIAGFPTVAVTTTEGKLTCARGWPNDKSEAKAFALVLREKIGA
ncbi:hypothetical protein NDI39_05455 [Microcoleus sp. ZQ-A2]|jgi:hypothetical protein|nr:hypothetical protein [Microcoleus sp. FACHB-1]